MTLVRSQLSLVIKSIFAVAISAIVFATHPQVTAQQRPNVFRIGFLDSSTDSGSAVLVETFRKELSNLGWVEGKNFTIEYRFAEQKTERLPELAEDLVRLNSDVIVSTSTSSALAAKQATASIPIVMANVGDPVAAGLVVSLARPGANVTGLVGLSTQLNTKRLEILKDVVPNLARVGLLRRFPLAAGIDLQLKELRAVAGALKIKLEEIDIQNHDPKGLENGFKNAKHKRVNAITTPVSRPIFAERKRIVELASRYRFPAIYFQKEFVHEGGLMSYGTDYDDLFRRSAHYVDKILKGAKPADLPVEQPTKFELVINLKAAKQIGLTIPPNVLARADKVIK
jgi:putative tryptophan/tyrosine transport system substrate-binding protein